MIVTANIRRPLVDGLLASNLPTVLVGHRRADRSASYVDVDHVAAADAITTHLVRSAGAGSATSGVRAGRGGRGSLAGYRRAMVRVGARPTGWSSTATSTPSSGRAATALLDVGVDAIFCANDATAEGALHTIRAGGLRVPADVALAGFDDLEFAAQLDPPLTTVRQEVGEQGAAGGRDAVPAAPGPRGRAAAGDPPHRAGHPAVDRGRCGRRLSEWDPAMCG